MTYQYIFGPVPSRRLGLSLGVDLTPHKTCTLDCVYCESGKTTHLTIQPTPLVDLNIVKEELVDFFASEPVLDYVTFSGAGEPTLHDDIGNMVQFLKTRFPRYKVALLTNGTLLYEKDIVRSLLDIDVVIASLDAGTEKGFNQMNRPHPRLHFKQVVEGLISFRKIFKNQFWIEVFIVPGMNDTEAELKPIKQILSRIKPDKIQINSLDRPGTESWVAPLDPVALEKISVFLKGAEIIKAPCTRDAAPGRGGMSDQIYAALKRRPCTSEDISRMFGIEVVEAEEYLHLMLKNNLLKTIKLHRGVFYTVKNDAVKQLKPESTLTTN